MRIDSIYISDFKNIEEARLDFSPAINCIVGSNGMGKSNLLEAVYYLSTTRSFLRLADSELLRHGRDAMLLKGDYTLDSGSGQSVAIGFQRGKRKSLRSGGKEVARASDHIGRLPVIVAAPADTQLITGAPEERRRMLDTLLCQADGMYLRSLMAYNSALQQRNAAMKRGGADPLVLDSLEMNMAQAARVVIDKREAFAREAAPHFAHFYEVIAGGRSESPGMTYAPSRPAETLEHSLRESRSRDSLLGFTTVGPHRDDLHLTLGAYDLKRLGSQGQIKTFTLALRLALHQFTKQLTMLTPLLLLDDIFDKLDASRVQGILHLIASESLAQTFITDTGREHIDALLRSTPAPSLLLEAGEGRYEKILGI